MLKQGVVQEALTDMNLPAASLPPLNNLPQWSRVNALDKARYPKPFLKDRLQPLPNRSAESSERDEDPQDTDKELEIEENMNPKQRIHHLERSVHFLTQQHHEILANLHEEIDGLKRDNKELQFRLVMMTKRPESTGSPKQKAHSAKEPVTKSRSGESAEAGHKAEIDTGVTDNLGYSDNHLQDEKIEELKVIFLEEEIKELKKALRDEKNRNNMLSQMLAQAERRFHGRERSSLSQHKSTVGDHRERKVASAHAATASPHINSSHDDEDADGPPSREPLPFNATLEPMLVRLGPDSRPPTLQECHVIMKHLQQVNDKQSHELSQLKSDLRDVLYSHKWTPDAYLLAKAYIAEDDAREAAIQDRLPKIPLRQPTRKLPDIAYIQKDALSLPALKQTMGNKAIERRKRTQVLHKARLRREMENPTEVTET